MQEKIKVLFVITQSEMGGAQRFLNTLIESLDKDKYEMELAAGPGNWEGFSGIDIPRIKLISAQRGISPINDIKTIFELRKTIRTFNPNILFLNSSKTTVWGPLAVWGLKNKPKIIYRIGGWSFNDPRPEWERKVWIWIEKVFAKYKDEIILNNKLDFDQAKKFKIKPRGNIHIVQNGLDVDKLYFLPRDEARIALDLNTKDRVVGTISNFYKTKGLEYIVHAAKLLPNTKFVIIGDGEGRNDLEKLIKDNNLKEKVMLLGRKNNAYKYLRAFDVYLSPSIKEGFPWVILEAMAAKVPIIATNVGAIPEIITNEYSGVMIEPKRPQQIAEALDKIQKINTVENAYDTLNNKFTLSRMVSKIEEIINS